MFHSRKKCRHDQKKEKEVNISPEIKELNSSKPETCRKKPRNHQNKKAAKEEEEEEPKKKKHKKYESSSESEESDDSEMAEEVSTGDEATTVDLGNIVEGKRRRTVVNYKMVEEEVV